MNKSTNSDHGFSEGGEVPKDGTRKVIDGHLCEFSKPVTIPSPTLDERLKEIESITDSCICAISLATEQKQAAKQVKKLREIAAEAVKEVQIVRDMHAIVLAQLNKAANMAIKQAKEIERLKRYKELCDKSGLDIEMLDSLD